MMNIERELYKRDKLKKRADDLDAWLERQMNLSKDDRLHHLSMPHDSDAVSAIKDVVETLREKQFEIEDRIKRKEERSRRIEAIAVSHDYSDEEKVWHITSILSDDE